MLYEQTQDREHVARKILRLNVHLHAEHQCSHKLCRADDCPEGIRTLVSASCKRKQQLAQCPNQNLIGPGRKHRSERADKLWQHRLDRRFEVGLR
jgi:hypothetical protein